MDKEFAAGGVVGREGKVLLIKARNLKGEQVWTFPKGHPNPGELPEQTALREVEEETGWRCRAVGELTTVSYRFSRHGRPVAKRVRWFRMTPLKKVGKADAGEILSTRWVAVDQAPRRLTYPSDFKLLELYCGKKA